MLTFERTARLWTGTSGNSMWSAPGGFNARLPEARAHTAHQQVPSARDHADAATSVESTSAHRHEASVSEGAPLPSSVRAYFEPRFGHDFSKVRVHADTGSNRWARAIDARAFTWGSDIVFQTGAYSPETASGRRLLAHELTHVVQQNKRAATTKPQQSGFTTVAISQPSDAAERQADTVATAFDTTAANVVDAPHRLPDVSSIGDSIQREATGGASGTADPMEHLAGTLYAIGPDKRPLPPSLDDLSQGGLNDCFLFGALAAIVSSDPKRIVSMIAYGPNHTYTVIFKGIGFFSSAKQTVSADFAKGKHGNVTTRRALWPVVIEKAYAQEKGGLDVLDKGGNAGDVLDDMLNDSPSRFDPRTKTVDYILGKIAKGKQKKWPMTILSPKQADATKEKREMADSSGLHFWHTYAITDVDAKNNRIKLFNPWGNSHPNGDGWISVADVRKYFIEIDIND